MFGATHLQWTYVQFCFCLTYLLGIVNQNWRFTRRNWRIRHSQVINEKPIENILISGFKIINVIQDKLLCFMTKIVLSYNDSTGKLIDQSSLISFSCYESYHWKLWGTRNVGNVQDFFKLIAFVYEVFFDVRWINEQFKTRIFAWKSLVIFY